MFSSNTLPDVTAKSNPEISAPLQWVGMEQIAIPISIKWQTGQLQTVTAKANVFVNIEKSNAKGIHMSRLYTIINQLAERECTKENIEYLLDEMIGSQTDISNEAKIELSFEMLLKKSALISDKSGYQSYNVSINAQKTHQGFLCEFNLVIPYSSTCPCSASLARQLYADAVNTTFTKSDIDKETLLKWIQSDAGSIATPHSQRSYAYIGISVGDGNWPNLSQLILQLESAIGTPVQTAVKRNDEQEFARLNASNLMFCEDAARRVKKDLDQVTGIEDYWFKIEHQESLHAHNAVVIDRKISP